MTEYLVFFRDPPGDEYQFTWIYAAAATARSARAAIREVCEGQAAKVVLPDERPVELVAVPSRSWQPVTVKVETKTALKFS